jgi:hypothetical protein
MGSLEELADSGMIKLKDAVELYRKEDNAVSNSYEWYRRNAREDRLSIAGLPIKAEKRSGTWYIAARKLKQAIENHRKRQKDLEAVADDLEKGIVRPGNQLTSKGGYTNKGNFRLEWNAYEVVRKRSYGTWYCNGCNKPAQTEHKKNECHLCSDWNGCSEDCTLSRVYCDDCNKSMKI